MAVDSKTHSKEDPLQQLAVVLDVARIEPELLLYVPSLSEVKKNSSALEDWKPIEAVAGSCGEVESGNTVDDTSNVCEQGLLVGKRVDVPAIGVHLDELPAVSH